MDRSRAAEETARTALRRAFGTTPCDALRLLNGGASGAFPFRADVGGRQYLVRVEGAASPLRNPRQYDSMAIAAAAGIAPVLHHADEAERVAVLDFVDECPLAAYPGGRAALATALGELLAQLQATPPFPPFMAYPDIVQRLWAHVCRTGLFAPGALDPHTERLDRIRAGLRREAVRPVSSHGDPVPRNILFDGRRLWLIDWESACANDPLVDAAIMLDNLAPTPELEGLFLAAWLGRAPGEDLRGRLAAVRALTRLYYAGVLLSAAAAAFGAVAQPDLAAPSAPEFEKAVRTGLLHPGTPATKFTLGRMYLAAFATDAVPPGLEAST